MYGAPPIEGLLSKGLLLLTELAIEPVVRLPAAGKSPSANGVTPLTTDSVLR